MIISDPFVKEKAVCTPTINFKLVNSNKLDSFLDSEWQM